MLLKVENLSKKLGNFFLRPLSFHIKKGETLGVLGESGSGKTTLFNLLLHLMKPDSGKILVDGKDLLQLSPKERALLLQGVFQNPSQSLDPRKTIRFLLAEPLLLHKSSFKEKDLGHLLKEVGLPEGLLNYNPSQLSGGQLQRVAIARAIALNPKILIADEPLSALDPSVQTQILSLFFKMKKERAIIFISHETNPLFFLSDKVMVLYKGWVMEYGPAEEVFKSPLSPYTQFLLDPGERDERPLENPACPFAPLCPRFEPTCLHLEPALKEPLPFHFARCHFL